MSVLITVSLGNDHLVLRNREIEHVEVVSRLGEPHRCLVRFDLDTNHTDCLQDFHGELSVDIALEDGSAKAVLFQGVMTGGTQDHQLDGGSRFELLAVSPLLLGMERHQSATRFQTSWDEAAKALDLQVIGPPRFRVMEHGYRMFGESRLEFVRRMADDAGYFVIERDGAVQLRSEFDDAHRRELTWGRQLLGLRARTQLGNHRFRGGVYERAVKADYRFRDQHQEPAVTGALKLTDAVKNVAFKFAGGQDLNLVMSDSRAAARDIFREALHRESERTLGVAVAVEGRSLDFLVKLGETVQVVDAPGFALTGSTGVFGVVELKHLWDSSEYHNAFVASPWKNFSNHIRPPLRHAAGPFLAEAMETPAETLAIGFLFVRMAHMDRDPANKIYARIVTPFAGNQRGFIFVPEPGDEVLIDFLQGDPEHAILIGSLWNGKDGCAGQEPKQIVTKNGNVLALHDDGWIELYTPEGKCMLQMSNKDGKPRVTLHSEGDLVLEAKGQIQVRAASLHEAISGGVLREIGGDEKVTVSGRMDHSADGLMKHNGSLASVMTGGGSKLSLTADAARLAGVMGILDGGAMAIVTGGMVQLNPPVVPPELLLKTPPPQLPGELATTWAKRNVPAATPPFDTDQDPPPSTT